MPRGTSFLGVVVLLSGCAYFNGMYNANKFAKDAERSERAGRPAEARDRWQRAAIHAESVVARHPRSRWADDARLVRGRALLRLGEYADAVDALTEAAAAAQDDEQRREALLLLGQAATAAGRFADAGAALDSAAQSARPERRSRALLARGRLRLVRRDAAGALADFAESREPEAPFWSARAALALGDAERAAAELMPLLSRRVAPQQEASWLRVLDTLGLAGASGASHATVFVDALVGAPGLTPGGAARLLLADGSRLARRGDTAAAGGRFRAAAALAPDSAEARTAELRLVLLALRGARDDSALAAARRALDRIARLGGEAAREAEAPIRQLGRLAALAADTGPGADARWFARAELARDSLAMPGYATDALAAMAERYPASPWTPKALIAAIAQGAADSAALAATLEQRYGDSPYLAAARGDDAPRYAALEDSLRSLLATSRPDAVPLREDRQDDEPGPRRPVARPRPAAPRPTPQTRNPEP